MILVVALAAVVIAAARRHGTLVLGRSLADLEVHRRSSVVGALVAQAVLTEVLAGHVPPGAARLAHIVTYLVAGWFLWCNRRLPGASVLGVGGALNAAAIVANGGVMPATVSASAAAGIAHADGAFVNSGPIASARLALLGDVFAWPQPLPLANVFSVGDVLLVGGIGYLLFSVPLLDQRGRRDAGAR